MKKEFVASRIGGESFWYPEKIILTEGAVTYVKKGIFSRQEVSIPYDQIASVRVQSGLLYSEIFIESTGGETIEAKGFSRGEAREIKEFITRKMGE